jgi:hypothetical protein
VPELAKSEGGIVATSVVADTYVLETSAEFALTVEVGKKLDPVISTWVAGDPTEIIEGVTDDCAGAKLLTENDAEAEVPPPGLGFVTVMLCVAARARLAPGTAMLSSVDDTKLVVWALPSRLATDDLMNPEPIKVTDVSGDPTVADVGEMLLNDGSGLDGGGVVNVFEPPPAHPMRDANRITAPIKEMWATAKNRIRM